MKKFLSVCLVLMLALSCFGAIAEEADLQSKIEDLSAQVEELQTKVDAYYPYYVASVVADFADGTVITVADMQAKYDEMDAQYSQYGFSMASIGMEQPMKIQIVNDEVERVIVAKKAAELGLDTIDEETEAVIRDEAKAQMDYYIDYYCQYFFADQNAETEEEPVFTDEQKAEAEAYWASNGITEEYFYESEKEVAVSEKVRAYIVKDVEVTEEDIQTAYEAAVATDEQQYAEDDYTYNSSRNGGNTIYWNPEGYRAVKQVLIKFNDDQSARMTELNGQLTSLNTELDTVKAIAAGEQEADAETEYRSEEDITADIAACEEEIEALYGELAPKTEEVVAAFNDGTAIEELIAEYNEDPGMSSEPIATIGYAVTSVERNATWDPAFVAATWSIAEKGGISEPTRGSYGFYIVYYMDDIVPGAVALETVRDAVEADVYSEICNTVYSDQISEWANEMGVNYYWESFGVTDPGDAN